MKLRFADAAEADVENVLSWYRERGLDLADQFLLALDLNPRVAKGAPEV